jgi:hypothetical protein
MLRLNIFPIWHYNNSNQIKKHEKEETQTERKKTTQDLPESEIVVFSKEKIQRIFDTLLETL